MLSRTSWNIKEAHYTSREKKTQKKKEEEKREREKRQRGARKEKRSIKRKEKEYNGTEGKEDREKGGDEKREEREKWELSVKWLDASVEEEMKAKERHRRTRRHWDVNRQQIVYLNGQPLNQCRLHHRTYGSDLSWTGRRGENLKWPDGRRYNNNRGAMLSFLSNGFSQAPPNLLPKMVEQPGASPSNRQVCHTAETCVAWKASDLGLSNALTNLGLELFPSHTFRRAAVQHRSDHEWRTQDHQEIGILWMV